MRKIALLLASMSLAVVFASGVTLLATEKLDAATTLPPGFEDRLLAAAGTPIALAFTPDDRMLVATQPGQLRVYKSGTLL